MAAASVAVSSVRIHSPFEYLKIEIIVKKRSWHFCGFQNETSWGSMRLETPQSSCVNSGVCVCLAIGFWLIRRV